MQSSLCRSPHDLDTSEKFLKMSLADCIELVKSKALCLRCLKWGHVKKNCRRRKVCNPTPPHSDFTKPPDQDKPSSTLKEEKPEATSNCVKVCDGKTVSFPCAHSLILTVWLYHDKNPQTKTLVYAPPDDQETALTVKQHTCRLL